MVSLSKKDFQSNINKKEDFLIFKHVKKIDIDPSILEDKEMLEDMVLVALKDALQKIESTTSTKMSGLVPPGMNLPF